MCGLLTTQKRRTYLKQAFIEFRFKVWIPLLGFLETAAKF